MNNKNVLTALWALFAAMSAWAQSPVALPPAYAMPAGSVTTTQPGFTVLPYQTTETQPGNVQWTLDQLAGLHGPNVADLSGADTNGAYLVDTVVNWSDGGGVSVDGFPSAAVFPGITAPSPNNNFSEEVLTYLQFPTNGVYTLGVNSDDGFQVTSSLLNPKDTFQKVVLGQFNGNRGAGDSTFQVSVSQPGIYPIRLVYWQGGGGASVAFFSVITTSTSTNLILINDTTTPGALTAYASAKVAPPYISRFTHDPTGFKISINDDITSLKPGSVAVNFNGATVPVTTAKAGKTTTLTYAPANLIPSGVSNTVAVTFSDTASPANNGSGSFTYVEAAYSTLGGSDSVPDSAVDKTQGGFLYRIHQIDSNQGAAIHAANIAHAEAQLAGLLAADGPNVAAAGSQPDGSYVVTNLNFSLDASAEGSFNTANGHPDQLFPGIVGTSPDNIAGQVTGYLDLKPGFYTFAVTSADGFRLASATNPTDAFGKTLGIYDFRRTTTETRFGVAVAQAGLYPVRLVFFSQSLMADNAGTRSLEFYTVDSSGTKTLVNDPSSTNSVKAYWKRTAGYGSFVKYAGPSSFVSPFAGPDVGFKSINLQLNDGTSNKVDAATVALTVDGAPIALATSAAGGVTTASFTYTNTQLPRIVHSASLVFNEQTTGIQHTYAWNFNLLKNYVLPIPLYFEDFESTQTDSTQGTVPMVPAGWVAESHTGSEMDSSIPANDPSRQDPMNLNSDFYLGWVVVDTSFGPSKDLGVSPYAPQTLNGVDLTDQTGTNPVLSNHYLRAESDARSNFPSQIDYLTTKSYDLTGKNGIVIAFNSSYEQNQDCMVSIEYSVGGGTNWSPVLYWLQEGSDSQAQPDIIRDGLGNIDVNAVFNTVYGDVAVYPNAQGEYIGGTGYYGAFIKAPISQALAPYIEGRVNDDGKESKRIELYRVTGADNQKDVRFRIQHDGTSSWYWAIDNWGVYSVPSLVTGPVTLGPLQIVSQNGSAVISWTGAGTLQSATNVGGPWSNVSGVTGTSYTAIVAPGGVFFRLTQ